MYFLQLFYKRLILIQEVVLDRIKHYDVLKHILFKEEVKKKYAHLRDIKPLEHWDEQL